MNIALVGVKEDPSFIHYWQSIDNTIVMNNIWITILLQPWSPLHWLQPTPTQYPTMSSISLRQRRSLKYQQNCFSKLNLLKQSCFLITSGVPTSYQSLFPNDSQLREIGDCAFYRCKSLQSTYIQKVSLESEHALLVICINLESVLFTDQSCLRIIGDGTLLVVVHFHP